MKISCQTLCVQKDSMKRYCQTLELVDDFDWDREMARLSKLPRQAEWEAFVAEAQGSDPDATSAQKWHLMDIIFDQKLY